jgi:RNA polymerase sigma-70 factor (ECF subfamily)
MTAAAALSNDFVTLTHPHLPRLFRIGMQLTHQASESQDLVQEALTKAWANWHRFEESGSLGAWLSRILINTFISRHRHQKVVDESAAPEGNWHNHHFSDEVLAALASLPAHYREVVELVDIQGLAYKEAADELGCPLGTVMSRLHRARRLLRDQLTDYATGYGLKVAC